MTALVGAGTDTASEDDVGRATAAAAALLAAAEDVTLLAHVRPDADALGSALALGTSVTPRPCSSSAAAAGRAPSRATHSSAPSGNCRKIASNSRRP